MKFVGQDKIGRLILDGEGETIEIEKGVPADSLVKITNFNTFLRRFERRIDNILVSAENGFPSSYPLRISILDGTDRGRKMDGSSYCPGDILSIADAKRFARDILDAVEYLERIRK